MPSPRTRFAPGFRPVTLWLTPAPYVDSLRGRRGCPFHQFRTEASRRLLGHGASKLRSNTTIQPNTTIQHNGLIPAPWRSLVSEDSRRKRRRRAVCWPLAAPCGIRSSAGIARAVFDHECGNAGCPVIGADIVRQRSFIRTRYDGAPAHSTPPPRYRLPIYRLAR